METRKKLEGHITLTVLALLPVLGLHPQPLKHQPTGGRVEALLRLGGLVYRGGTP